jgi:hypothetical protein
MAESEVTGYRKSFQVINDIGLLDVSSIKEVFYHETFCNDDPILLRALANKLEKIRSNLNLQSLHAISCGINCNLFVLKQELDFGIYYNCSYSGLDEKIPSIESCYFFKKPDGSYKHYICSRYNKILLCGYQISIDFEPTIIQFEQTFDGVVSCVLQQQIDIQNQTFLSDYAEEIEVKANATF